MSFALITYIPGKAKSQEETVPVTVFVHGYKGTYNSFGNMLNRFESNQWGNKALVYRVSSEGYVRAFNLNRGKTKPVFIQVIFEDNRASFNDGARWLSNVLSHLKQYYQINNVNLVGHSMGGLISVKYIEEYDDRSRYPVTDKLVTIGSPFDGIYNKTYFQYNRDEAATDLKPNSAALQLLRSTKEMIPSNLNVLNIGSTGDPIAVPESVKALRMIIPAEQMETVIIENDELGHSELHESRYVDQLIHSFLLNAK